MGLDIQQLAINVNLHSLQPNFLNSELHYVIAETENIFRFADWNEEPLPGETKFYCHLTEQQLVIPAGNISLDESYAIKEEPVYPIITTCVDFINAVEKLQYEGVAKYIRRFFDSDIDDFRKDLESHFGTVAKHLVKSGQGQHLLLVFDSSEVSISANMVYMRPKASFSDKHYKHVKEEQQQL